MLDPEVGRAADGARHDRGRAARVHARPHAQRLVHHPRRGAEHDARADEDVPHPARLRLEDRRHRRRHPDRPARGPRPLRACSRCATSSRASTTSRSSSSTRATSCATASCRTSSTRTSATSAPRRAPRRERTSSSLRRRRAADGRRSTSMRWVRLARLVLAEERVPGDAELSLIFVDEDDDHRPERALPRRRPARPTCSRSRSTTTSCPAAASPTRAGGARARRPRPASRRSLLGDVVVCPTVAAAPGARARLRRSTTSSRCSSCTASCICSTTTTPIRATRRSDATPRARAARPVPASRAASRRRRRHEREQADERRRLGDRSSSIVVLFLVSIVLALAETAFTRMNRIRALALEEEGRKGARAARARCSSARSGRSTSLLLLVLVTPADERVRCSASCSRASLGSARARHRPRAADRRCSS